MNNTIKLTPYKLGDCLFVKHGWSFKGEFFSNIGEQCILTPGNFYEEGGFKENNGKERYYTGAYPDEYLCKKGDLIVAMTQQTEGLLGSTALVPEDNKYLHNQRIGLITCNENVIEPMFAYYLFMTKTVREQLERSASGTKVKHTSPERIYDVEVKIPDVPSQHQIALFLQNIDSKIELNNSICSDLEAMAKLLYDYWFVQFDFPDENGKPYKSSGGKMVWNEELKREIPEGWDVGNLYSIADFINGIACQKYRPINDVQKLPVIKITEMHNGITDSTEFARDDIDSSYIIQNGDILFSWSASLEVQRWNNGKGVLNQHIFKVNPLVASSNYVYLQLKSYVINFVKMAEARKTTMGHITTDHIKQSRIAIPPTILLQLFEERTHTWFKQQTNAMEENQELASLRDFLLPMLMNGQVTVGKPKN